MTASRSSDRGHPRSLDAIVLAQVLDQSDLDRPVLDRPGRDRALVDRQGPARPVLDRAVIRDLTRAGAPLEPLRAIDAAVDRAESWVHGLGPLEPHLADQAVTEVMVNGDGTVWVERTGALAITELRLETVAVLHLIERIVAPLGLRVDQASPVVDARLPDGSRVHAIIPPLAIDGPCLTIRRFGTRRIGLADLAGPEVGRLLREAVRRRSNILVSGGTGSGKTTLLNALAAELHPDERVITVEDAAELRLPGRQVLRLESRPANAEGVGEVRIRDLVRSALRMRPDRIVVGEIRDGAALDMLQAMNTGHDGSLSTCHANGPVDALRRVETLVLMGDVALPLGAVREQIASALDLIVQVARGTGGRRFVTGVHEVGRVEPSGGIGTALLADGDGVIRPPSRPARRPDLATTTSTAATIAPSTSTTGGIS